MKHAVDGAFLRIEDTIGNTPLVQLRRVVGADSARRNNVILAKLEGNNPGGSVKDRGAWSMITRAAQRGAIRSGDRLIEATSGNTGIALAMNRCDDRLPDDVDHAGQPQL